MHADGCRSANVHGCMGACTCTAPGHKCMRNGAWVHAHAQHLIDADRHRMVVARGRRERPQVPCPAVHLSEGRESGERMCWHEVSQEGGRVVDEECGATDLYEGGMRSAMRAQSVLTSACNGSDRFSAWRMVHADAACTCCMQLHARAVCIWTCSKAGPEPKVCPAMPVC